MSPHRMKDFDPQGFVGRTVIRVVVDEPEGWQDSEAVFTLDDGSVVTIHAYGWHDSGTFGFDVADHKVFT